MGTSQRGNLSPRKRFHTIQTSGQSILRMRLKPDDDGTVMSRAAFNQHCSDVHSRPSTLQSDQTPKMKLGDSLVSVPLPTE